MKLLTVGTGMLLLAATAGCSNTAKGVKEDSEVVAEKTADAATATKEAVGGAMLTTEIKSAIVADSRVDASDINVDTDESRKTVTLKGSVKTTSQKQIAGELASGKAVGYSIVNNLTIMP